MIEWKGRKTGNNSFNSEYFMRKHKDKTIVKIMRHEKKIVYRKE
jgi:hypothetical protein